MSIRFLRIDDRLIHGQVVTAWIKYHHAHRVVIVDNEVNQDDFLKGVLKMVAPSDIQLVITGTHDLGEELARYEADEKNTIILVKTPQTARQVLDNGMVLRELNVGGMGANHQRKKLYKNISASDEEVGVLRELEAAGVKVYIQVVPADKQILLGTLK